MNLFPYYKYSNFLKSLSFYILKREYILNMIKQNLTNIEQGLSYDDVLVIPQKSPINTRSNVNTNTRLIRDIHINKPIISASMDSVTEFDMAQAMTDNGGVGIIHRYLDVEEQAKEVKKVNGVVGATIGVNELWEDRVNALVDANVDFICLDVAHGHMEKAINVTDETTNITDIPIMAGNVATPQGAIDLIEAGAESIKVGVGPGSHCLTREVAGVGVPQITAINNIKHKVNYKMQMNGLSEITVVADGGIQTSGDIVKALVTGADSVMIGGLLAGCKESPAPLIETDEGIKYKKTRGMASGEARNDNEMETTEAIEGASGYTPYSGSAETVLTELSSGVRSGFSYVGASNIKEAQEYGKLIRVTPTVPQRNGTHGVYTSKE